MILCFVYVFLCLMFFPGRPDAKAPRAKQSARIGGRLTAGRAAGCAVHPDWAYSAVRCSCSPSGLYSRLQLVNSIQVVINLEILGEQIKILIFFGAFWASPGPGVAGYGLCSKNHDQKWGRDWNPCPGDPFRGHFPCSRSLRRRVQLELENYYIGNIFDRKLSYISEAHLKFIEHDLEPLVNVVSRRNV